MRQVVYITRHSMPFRDLFENYNASEDTQLRNEKNILSVEGERRAKLLSENIELQDIDLVYSSHYVRCMSTAKYVVENNNIKLNVDERFGERKFGVDKISNLPKTFFVDQFKNRNYKIGDGESLREVKERITTAFNEILNNNPSKKILIVSHGTALSLLLENWCTLNLNEDTGKTKIYFNNEMVFDGNWNTPELFKLVLEDNKLVCIENISI